MSILIFNHGAGGKKELLVKVQVGIVQPTGKLGLLWVNTSTAIPKTTWAAAQPSSPATGDAWIQTDAASANIISLLAMTTTTVYINVLRVKQWTGAAWTSRAAYYHNGTSWTQVSNTFSPQTDITYTGTMQYVDDGNGHWRIKFLTSGNLTLANSQNIDVFLVGAGGGGSQRAYSGYKKGGAGGGGGYTRTQKSVTLSAGTIYPIVVGAGGAVGGESEFSQGGTGGTTSAFGYSATGGIGGYGATGGAGGSGGGKGNPSQGGVGGSDGANGADGASGGTGQGTTTREFGDAGGTLYSGGGGGGSIDQYGSGGAGGAGGGGGGGSWNVFATNPAANSGGGGGGIGGGTYGGATVGGTGIVVIRDHRAA